MQAQILKHLISETPRVLVVDGSRLVRKLIADVLKRQLPQVQVALAALQTQYDSNWTLVMAAASLSMIPPVAIALALHRPLTRSIDMGDLR